MIITRITIFILIFLYFTLAAHSQDDYKDPFGSLLPEEEDVQTKPRTKRYRRKEVKPPPVVVEGILWGSKTPQTIIDSEVYKVGDKLKSVDATVFKIEKNEVFISYGEKIFKMKTEKGGKK